MRVANQTPQPFKAPGAGMNPGLPSMGADPYQAAYSMDQSMPSLVPQDIPQVPTGQRRIVKRGARRAQRLASKPKRGNMGALGMKATGSSMAF